MNLKFWTLDVTKTIFGPCLSLCLQSVLIAYNEKIKTTQILTTVFSLIVITKTTTALLSFKKTSISELLEDNKGIHLLLSLTL